MSAKPWRHQGRRKRSHEIDCAPRVGHTQGAEAAPESTHGDSIDEVSGSGEDELAQILVSSSEGGAAVSSQDDVSGSTEDELAQVLVSSSEGGAAVSSQDDVSGSAEDELAQILVSSSEGGAAVSSQDDVSGSAEDELAQVLVSSSEGGAAVSSQDDVSGSAEGELAPMLVSSENGGSLPDDGPVSAGEKALKSPSFDLDRILADSLSCDELLGSDVSGTLSDELADLLTSSLSDAEEPFAKGSSTHGVGSSLRRTQPGPAAPRPAAPASKPPDQPPNQGAGMSSTVAPALSPKIFLYKSSPIAHGTSDEPRAGPKRQDAVGHPKSPSPRSEEGHVSSVSSVGGASPGSPPQVKLFAQLSQLQHKLETQWLRYTYTDWAVADELSRLSDLCAYGEQPEQVRQQFEFALAWGQFTLLNPIHDPSTDEETGKDDASCSSSRSNSSSSNIPEVAPQALWSLPGGCLDSFRWRVLPPAAPPSSAPSAASGGAIALMARPLRRQRQQLTDLALLGGTQPVRSGNRPPRVLEQAWTAWCLPLPWTGPRTSTLPSVPRAVRPAPPPLLVATLPRRLAFLAWLVWRVARGVLVPEPMRTLALGPFARPSGIPRRLSPLQGSGRGRSGGSSPALDRNPDARAAPRARLEDALRALMVLRYLVMGLPLHHPPGLIPAPVGLRATTSAQWVEAAQRAAVSVLPPLYATTTPGSSATATARGTPASTSAVAGASSPSRSPGTGTSSMLTSDFDALLLESCANPGPQLVQAMLFPYVPGVEATPEQARLREQQCRFQVTVSRGVVALLDALDREFGVSAVGVLTLFISARVGGLGLLPPGPGVPCLGSGDGLASLPLWTGVHADYPLRLALDVLHQLVLLGPQALAARAMLPAAPSRTALPVVLLRCLGRLAPTAAGAAPSPGLGRGAGVCEAGGVAARGVVLAPPSRPDALPVKKLILVLSRLILAAQGDDSAIRRAKCATAGAQTQLDAAVRAALQATPLKTAQTRADRPYVPNRSFAPDEKLLPGVQRPAPTPPDRRQHAGAIPGSGHATPPPPPTVSAETQAEAGAEGTLRAKAAHTAALAAPLAVSPHLARCDFVPLGQAATPPPSAPVSVSTPAPAVDPLYLIRSGRWAMVPKATVTELELYMETVGVRLIYLSGDTGAGCQRSGSLPPRAEGTLYLSSLVHRIHIPDALRRLEAWESLAQVERTLALCRVPRPVRSSRSPWAVRRLVTSGRPVGGFACPTLSGVWGDPAYVEPVVGRPRTTALVIRELLMLHQDVESPPSGSSASSGALRPAFRRKVNSGGGGVLCKIPGGSEPGLPLPLPALVALPRMQDHPLGRELARLPVTMLASGPEQLPRGAWPVEQQGPIEHLYAQGHAVLPGALRSCVALLADVLGLVPAAGESGPGLPARAGAAFAATQKMERISSVNFADAVPLRILASGWGPSSDDLSRPQTPQHVRPPSAGRLAELKDAPTLQLSNVQLAPGDPPGSGAAQPGTPGASAQRSTVRVQLESLQQTLRQYLALCPAGGGAGGVSPGAGRRLPGGRGAGGDSSVAQAQMALHAEHARYFPYLKDPSPWGVVVLRDIQRHRELLAVSTAMFLLFLVKHLRRNHLVQYHSALLALDQACLVDLVGVLARSPPLLRRLLNNQLSVVQGLGHLCAAGSADPEIDALLMESLVQATAGALVPSPAEPGGSGRSSRQSLVGSTSPGLDSVAGRNSSSLKLGPMKPPRRSRLLRYASKRHAGSVPSLDKASSLGRSESPPEPAWHGRSASRTDLQFSPATAELTSGAEALKLAAAQIAQRGRGPLRQPAGSLMSSKLSRVRSFTRRHRLQALSEKAKQLTMTQSTTVAAETRHLPQQQQQQQQHSDTMAVHVSPRGLHALIMLVRLVQKLTKHHTRRLERFRRHSGLAVLEALDTHRAPHLSYYVLKLYRSLWPYLRADERPNTKIALINQCLRPSVTDHWTEPQIYDPALAARLDHLLVETCQTYTVQHYTSWGRFVTGDKVPTLACALAEHHRDRAKFARAVLRLCGDPGALPDRAHLASAGTGRAQGGGAGARWAPPVVLGPKMGLCPRESEAHPPVGGPSSLAAAIAEVIQTDPGFLGYLGFAGTGSLRSASRSLMPPQLRRPGYTVAGPASAVPPHELNLPGSIAIQIRMAGVKGTAALALATIQITDSGPQDSEDWFGASKRFLPSDHRLTSRSVADRTFDQLLALVAPSASSPSGNIHPSTRQFNA